MTEKITVVMVGENIDFDKPVQTVATKSELAVLNDMSGVPMMVAMTYGVGALALDYDLEPFIVNLGDGNFVKGYYPYFTSEGWDTTDDYEKWYFGSLMVKSGHTWYTADWVNPDDNTFEMITFTKADTFDVAFINALTAGMEEYVKKNRANKLKG